MIKQNQGYSLGVLIITIAVMIIMTTVAITSFKNMSADKNVTNFMSDINEVEEYVREYFSTKHVLPIAYDDRNNPLTLSSLDFEEMRMQTSEKDFGEYYYIDLDKLERIHLNDKDRGYVVNENSLRVYVVNPITYQNKVYYTVTDTMKGYDKRYNTNSDFEILITGNPITWSESARLILSVPSLVASGTESVQEAASHWIFKYYVGGPISADEFKTRGKLFLYGELIEVKQNGIVSFYAENERGYAKVVNVIVTKVDDIEPTIQVKGGKLEILDNETGINPNKLLYKISGRGEDTTDSEGGRDLLTYGTNYSTYRKQYDKLTAEFNDLQAMIEEYRRLGSGETELFELQNELAQKDQDIRDLNANYPDFNNGFIPYPDGENNIVVYASDMAGNEYSLKAGISRDVLNNSSLIEYEVEPLANSVFSVVKMAQYVSGDKINLRIRSQGATHMLITLDSTKSPELLANYVPYEASNGGYEFNISTALGTNIPIYAYYTAGEYDEETGKLIYEALSDTFSVDRTNPTTTAPDVTISNQLELVIELRQEDFESGIGKIEYGYMRAERTENINSYTWFSTVSEIESLLEQGETYYIRTRVSDIAGNGPIPSSFVRIQCPVLKITTIPNAPVLNTMKAITWKPDLSEVEIDPVTLKDANGVTRTWYDYALGDGIHDAGTSKWANAKSTDGSYWVWIPRFAYKIIYYTTSSKSQIKGYYQNSPYTNLMGYYSGDGKTEVNETDVKTLYADIDVVFLYNAEDYKYCDAETKQIKSLVQGGERLYSEYIVHPAFKNYGYGTTVNTLGNFNRELTGFWVAKFETSRSDATYTSVGTASTVKSIPSVKSLSNITINQAYNYALNYSAAMQSHLIKNSEWGAVSYLAYSAYGRNGAEVKPNLASNQITGGGSTSNGATYASTSVDTFEGRYGYKTTAGMEASTTKNIYGVYDMVGGCNEFVSSYVNNSNTNLSTNGSALQNTSTIYFSQSYNRGATDDSSANYTANRGVFGDGIYEISTAHNRLMGKSTCTYPYTNTPFFSRGGAYSTDYASLGIFNVLGVNGAASLTNGFRIILTP